MDQRAIYLWLQCAKAPRRAYCCDPEAVYALVVDGFLSWFESDDGRLWYEAAIPSTPPEPVHPEQSPSRGFAGVDIDAIHIKRGAVAGQG